MARSGGPLLSVLENLHALLVTGRQVSPQHSTRRAREGASRDAQMYGREESAASGRGPGDYTPVNGDGDDAFGDRFEDAAQEHVRGANGHGASSSGYYASDGSGSHADQVCRACVPQSECRSPSDARCAILVLTCDARYSRCVDALSFHSSLSNLLHNTRRASPVSLSSFTLYVLRRRTGLRTRTTRACASRPNRRRAPRTRGPASQRTPSSRGW